MLRGDGEEEKQAAAGIGFDAAAQKIHAHSVHVLDVVYAENDLITLQRGCEELAVVFHKMTVGERVEGVYPIDGPPLVFKREIFHQKLQRATGLVRERLFILLDPVDDLAGDLVEHAVGGILFRFVTGDADDKAFAAGLAEKAGEERAFTRAHRRADDKAAELPSFQEVLEREFQPFQFRTSRDP